MKLILKADRLHPLNYPHTPTDYRHTDNHLELESAHKQTDGRTDRQTDVTKYIISLASRGDKYSCPFSGEQQKVSFSTKCYRSCRNIRTCPFLSFTKRGEGNKQKLFGLLLHWHISTLFPKRNATFLKLPFFWEGVYVSEIWV